MERSERDLLDSFKVTQARRAAMMDYFTELKQNRATSENTLDLEELAMKNAQKKMHATKKQVSAAE